MSLELELQEALNVEFFAQGVCEVFGQLVGQVRPALGTLGSVGARAKQHENRVGITIDHFQAPSLNEAATFSKDTMAPFGDGGNESVVKEAATWSAQNPIEGVHH